MFICGQQLPLNIDANQTASDRSRRRARSVRNADFVKDVLDVSFDCVLGNVLRKGDFLVRHSADDHLQNSLLGIRQFYLSDIFAENRRDIGQNKFLARADRANRFYEFIGRNVFADIAERAFFQGF